MTGRSLIGTIDLGPRTFGVDDPGLAPACILAGGGGGFTTVYSDFVFLPNGSVRFLTYSAGYQQSIPEDAESARLLRDGRSEQYLELIAEIEQMDFFSIPTKPITSEMAEYLVVTDETKGIHGVLWARGDTSSLPRSLRALVVRLRGILVERFQKEHRLI